MFRALLALTLLGLAGCDSRTEIDDSWKPRHLVSELGERGEVWESRPIPCGLVCKRPGDPTTWEQMLELAESHHTLWAQRPGRLLIVVNLAAHYDQADERGTLLLGRLVIHGHPEELDRIRKFFR